MGRRKKQQAKAKRAKKLVHSYERLQQAFLVAANNPDVPDDTMFQMKERNFQFSKASLNAMDTLAAYFAWVNYVAKVVYRRTKTQETREKAIKQAAYHIVQVWNHAVGVKAWEKLLGKLKDMFPTMTEDEQRSQSCIEWASPAVKQDLTNIETQIQGCATKLEKRLHSCLGLPDAEEKRQAILQDLEETPIQEYSQEGYEYAHQLKAATKQ